MGYGCEGSGKATRALGIARGTDLLAGYQGMKERQSKIPAASQPRLTEALQRLIDLYTAWEKPEEAAKWRQKLGESKPDR